MNIVKFSGNDFSNSQEDTMDNNILQKQGGALAGVGSFDRPEMIGEYVVDKTFSEHFKNLKQVFMYITDKCNISCEQCIYKPSINHYINEEIPINDILDLLKTFKKLGASKVTFLGGEPTLYGYRDNRKPLLSLISETKSIGYDYIRLDTNGQVISQLLPEAEFNKLDELAFSLDGFSVETNDILRGKGTFEKAIVNIKSSIEAGYKVTITCCVHRLLLTKDISGCYLIETMIKFAQELGVYQINFHDLFKAGVPMDTWTGDFSPSPEEWIGMYANVSSKISSNIFSIDVRLPQCFVKKEIFDKRPKYFGYCPVKLGERIMVHPNGIIRICSNLICTGFGVARYENRNILWDRTHNNEIAGHLLKEDTACTNRSRHRKYGRLIPLCFSFKPNQNEYVWKSKLEWDGNYVDVDKLNV